MSQEAQAWVIERSPYKGAGFAVHYCLADSVNDMYDHRFWMSNDNLAAKARVDRPTAARWVTTMVDDGFLEVLVPWYQVDELGQPILGRNRKLKPTGKPAEYRFLFPDVPVVWSSKRRKTAGEGGVRVLDTPLVAAEPHDGVSPGQRVAAGARADESPGGARSRHTPSDPRGEARDPDTPGCALVQHQVCADRAGGVSTARAIPREPQEEPQAETQPAADAANERSRDLLWDALIAACDVVGPIPKDARGAYNRAVKQLRDVDATPDDVVARARVYRRRWPDVSLTPTALARRWAECTDGTTPCTADPVREHAPTMAEIRARQEADEADRAAAVPMPEHVADAWAQAVAHGEDR